jgi:monoamine oxidase
MQRNFSRRRFVQAGLAAALPSAFPAGVFAQAREADVVVIGAGIAGIAAARRIAGEGRSHLVLEALPRVGGRVASRAAPLGTPADLGAHRLFQPARNPLAQLGRAVKFDLYPPLQSRRLYLGKREARDAEYDDFTATVRRAARAIAATGEIGQDVPASDALPQLGPWQETAEFVLGPLAFGAELSQLSTVDFARAADRSEELAARASLGALALAASLAAKIELAAPVRALAVNARRSVTVETAKGSLRAQAVIVTVPPAALTAERIRFSPDLPNRTLDALGRIRSGFHNRVVLELLGNPLRLKDDETLLFRAQGRRAMQLTGRIAGSDLAYVDIGGAFARELSVAGERAMIEYAIGTIVAQFGEAVRRKIGWSSAMRWDQEPFIGAAYGVAAPGHAAARRVLAEPVHERIIFAGEAIHETLFGTVAGAWASGERAADAALRLLPRRR